jgi:hypothetical protein
MLFKRSQTQMQQSEEDVTNLIRSVSPCLVQSSTFVSPVLMLVDLPLVQASSVRIPLIGQIAQGFQPLLIDRSKFAQNQVATGNVSFVFFPPLNPLLLQSDCYCTFRRAFKVLWRFQQSGPPAINESEFRVSFSTVRKTEAFQTFFGNPWCCKRRELRETVLTVLPLPG